MMEDSTETSPEYKQDITGKESEWDKQKYDQIKEVSHVTKIWVKDKHEPPDWLYLLPNNINMTEVDEAALFHIRQATNGRLCKVVWVTVNKKDGKSMRSSCHPFSLDFSKDEYYHRANIPIASLCFITCDDGTVVPLHDDRAVMYHVGRSIKANYQAKHHNQAVQIVAVLAGSEDHEAIEGFKKLRPDGVDGPLDKATYEFMRFVAATNTWWTPKSPADQLGEHGWPIHLYTHLAFAGRVPLIDPPAHWDFVKKNIGMPVTYFDRDRLAPSKNPNEKRHITAVVMSVDRESFYSSGIKLRRMMVAKATESVNVTFWNANIKKAGNIKAGQMIAFKNVSILNTNPQYQYTATTNVGITVTDDADCVDVTGTVDLPTPTSLKILREALTLSEGTTFGIKALVTDVAPFPRYGERWAVQIRDDSTEAAATILFDPKLVSKIGPNPKGYVFSFCELSVAGTDGQFGPVFTAKERKTFFWSHMVDARSYSTVIFRWAKSLGLLAETDVSRAVEQPSATGASTSAVLVPTDSGTESTSLTGNSEPVQPTQDSVGVEQLDAIQLEESAEQDQLQEPSQKRARYN